MNVSGCLDLADRRFPSMDERSGIVACFDLSSACIAELLTERGMVHESADGVDPLGGGVGEVAGVAWLNQFLVHADRVGDDGQAGGLVLQDLETTLATAPVIVGKPRDADVAAGKFGSFRRFEPVDGNGGDAWPAGKLIADDMELNAGQGLADGVPEAGLLLHTLKSAGGADPDEADAGARALVNSHGVPAGIDAGGHDGDLVGVGILGGTFSEKTVAGEDLVSSLNESLESGEPTGSFAACVVRVSLEEGVVEVEDQMA